MLTEMMRTEDRAVPEALLDRAKAIAVIPHVVKGAFIVGGRFGKGLLTARDESGTWGPAAYVQLSGASVGLQIGGQATDLIMVFIEEDGLEALLNDKVKLGVDASVAAGPLGRSAEAATNLTLDSAIYAYSRSKGLFAGIALDGAVLSMDDDTNHKVYDADVTGRDILLARTVSRADVTTPFLEAVQRFVPKDSK
jgi:lipid-binding SYLF domain-containing protein